MAIAGGARGVDVGHLGDRQRRGARNAGHLGYHGERDGDDQVHVDAEQQVLAEHGDDDHRENDDRKSQHDVDDALDDVIDAAAEVAGGGADQRAGRAAKECGEDADGHGRAGAIDEAREDIAPVLVRAHGMLAARRGEHGGEVDFLGVEGRDPVGAEREAEIDEDDEEADEAERLLADEVQHGVRPLRSRQGCGRGRGRDVGHSVSPAQADARVEPSIEQVDHKIDEDEGHGNQQHETLDEREVAAGGRVDEELADAVDVEDLLGDDEAADQEGELEADDGDDRQHGIAHGVAARDDAAEDALRARRADVVLTHDFEQGRAHHARRDGRVAVADRQRRPEERGEIGPRVLEDRDIADLRQPSEYGDQAQHDDHAEPEARDGEAGHGNDAHGVVYPGISVERG